MRLYYDDRGIIRVATTTPLITNLYRYVEVPEEKLPPGNPVGRRVSWSAGGGPGRGREMKVAVVCNWGDACGIATYSGFLLSALRPLVGAIKVFAEVHDAGDDAKQPGNFDVDYCWKRGTSLADMSRRLISWKPDVVLVQHEFGIFPRAPHLQKFYSMMDAAGVPVVTTLHSVYEHLDKVVCTAPMRNVVVHSQSGADCLRRLGHTCEIAVIPHGCVAYENVRENWNITHTPYAIVQFGFGFSYKGVEQMLLAIASLKQKYPQKYAGDSPLHYCYLCSESPHVRHVINEYFARLNRQVEELGLEDNVTIVRGFQTEQVLNQYLRTYKMAVFPYVTDPKNVVYGASGAARLAMANRIPTIASASHMFDDLEGILPRPLGVGELAGTIDKLFSSEKERKALVTRQDDYMRRNTWSLAASHYFDFLQSRIHPNSTDVIWV